MPGNLFPFLQSVRISDERITTDCINNRFVASRLPARTFLFPRKAEAPARQPSLVNHVTALPGSNRTVHGAPGQLRNDSAQREVSKKRQPKRIVS